MDRPAPTETAAAPRRARRGPWAAAALVALAAAGVGTAWSRHERDAASAGAAAPAASASGPGGGRAWGRDGGGARVQPVSVAAVRQRDIHVDVDAIGTIAAANTAVVRSKVDGELKAIYFKEGQAVKAGQVLALIDPRPFEIALGMSQGTLARDQAQLRNAQLDLQRYQDLVSRDAAPRQQLDTQQALVQQLQGAVQADQAAVDNAQLQLSYTRVLAPISGVAGLRQADLGNIVHAADPNGLVTIAQSQPAAVVFAVPDAQLPRIRAQMRAGVPLPVEAWDRDRHQRLALGRVDSTDNAIDPTTGTIRIKALFPNADNSLFPNQFVNVRLQLDTLAGATAVPTAAVQRGAPGTFVYALGADGTVALRRVTAGAVDGDWQAVQGDLAPGERVVTDGADRLRDGARVEVIAPSSAPGASGARAGRWRGAGNGGAA